MSGTMSGRRRRRVARPGEVIEVNLKKQCVALMPIVPGLEKEFYSVRHLPHPTSGRVSPLAFPLVRETTDGAGYHIQTSLAGLEPLLTEWLVQHGYQTRHTPRPEVLDPPVLDCLIGFGTAVDRDILNLVRSHDRGLIRYSAAVDPARLVAQIALAWPAASMLILATRREDAGRFCRRMRTYLPAVSLFAGSHCPPRADRVVVATLGFARDGRIGIEHRSFLISLDPTELFSTNFDTGLGAIRCAWIARIYGLMPVEQEVAPHNRSVVTMLFGPRELLVPWHGCRRRGVDVVFLPVRGGPPVSGADPVALKRQGLWRHPVRNRRLARLGRLLAGRKPAAVREVFPELASVSVGRGRGRVGLLVEDVEHGLALAEHLPRVPLVCGPAVWEEDLTPKQRKRVRAGQGDACRRRRLIIVTWAGLAGAGDLGVLIRADGGVGLPPLGDDLLLAPYGDDARLLLIDFRDRHHPALRRRSREREAAYAAAGWGLAGDPGSPAALLQQFLAARPEVLW
jgi:hypothetical protein